jgi:MFS family permease
VIRRLPDPLYQPQFRLLWLGRTVSHLGNYVVPVALTLVVIGETSSAADLGLILAAFAGAQLLCYLPGGVWADRLPRRLVMLTAELVSGVTQLAIGVELLAGAVNVAHLAGAAAVTGASAAFFLPASQGLIPGTVPADQLQKANALLGVAQRGAAMAGPAIATGLVLGVGGGWAFVLDAASFFLSAAALARLRVRQQPAARQTFRADLLAGWQEVRDRRWYWSNLVAHGVWNLSRTVYFTLGPLVVIGSLGGRLAWGVIVQVGTVGALAGAVLAYRAVPRYPLVAGNVCLALGALPLALLAVRAHPALIALAAALMYSALGLAGTLWDSTVQRHIPEHALSRVSAYDWLTSTALSPLGYAAAGVLAGAFGATAVLAGSAVVVAAVCVGVLAIPEVRSMRSEPVGIAA